MKISSFHLFSLCSLLFSISIQLARSADLIVDAGLTNQHGNIYPTLAQAFSALAVGGLLIDSSNTITLKASCLGKNQYFPGFNKNSANPQIHGVNSGTVSSSVNSGGSIHIRYENSPQSVNDKSICSQLPTLVLSDDSYFSLQNLDSVSITGLSIHYLADTNINRISNVKTLTFSNFCFNNTEPSNSLSNSSLNSFMISNVSKLSMTNGIYNYDSFKQVSITKVSETILDNIIFFTLSSSADRTYSALNITADSSFAASLDVTNLKIICEPGKLVMPFYISTSEIDNVSISSMDITGCNFNGKGTNKQAAIFIARGKNLNVQAVTLQDLISGLNSYQSIFSVTSVEQSTFSDFKLLNITMINMADFSSQIVLFSDVFIGYDYPMFGKFSGWSIANSNISSSTNIIHCYFGLFEDFGGMIVENFTIENTYFDWLTCFIDFQIAFPINNTLNQKTAFVQLDNINITRSVIKYSVIGNFYFYYARCTYLTGVENAHIKISNFRFHNNRVYQSAVIFQAESFLTSFSNIYVENNHISSSSSFYSSNNYLSSLLAKNLVVRNLTLEDHSAFASSNITGVREVKLESSMDAKPGVFAETRPFLIYNSSFEEITAEGGSYLFGSTNPMIVIQRNNFTNITLNHSGLFELGDYLDFFSTKSFFIECWRNAHIYNPTSRARLVFTAAEALIFQKDRDLQAIYNDARATIAGYDPENAITFIWVSENNFQALKTNRTSHLIHIFSFEIPNGTIAVFNNAFDGISAKNAMNFVGISNIFRGILALNKFSKINLPGIMFALTSSYFDNLYLDSNAVSFTEQLAFASISSGKCNRIHINSNNASNLKAEQTFMAISCDIIETKLMMQGSRFENISQVDTPRVLGSLNFISLTTKSPSSAGISSIIFQDNYFYNTTILNTQGYTQGIYQSSFIFILSIDSTFQSVNSTFDLITAAPKGSIMTLSLPRISFANSKFQNLSFGSIDGAFHAIFETISIKNCSFLTSKSLSAEGAGLFKLTNHNPQEIVLIVDFKDNVFQENTAPHGTVLSVHDTPMLLYLNANAIANNQVTRFGGLIHLFNVSTSNLIITNTNFSQYEGYHVDYPSLTMIYFDYSGADIFVQMMNLRVKVTGDIVGGFVSVSGQHPVKILATNISYSVGSDLSFPQFGLFKGDNFDATFTSLTVDQITLGPTGIFTIDANTAGKKNCSKWHLGIYNSAFNSMTLFDALIVVDADGYIPTALNNLSIQIQNIIVSNISWVSSTSNGVVRSTTPLIGKSQKRNDFAIVINNSTFAEMSGGSGLILHSVEPIFDAVAFVSNCVFTSLRATGPGAILNPSASLLRADHHMKPNDHERSLSFYLTNNSFRDIHSQSGALLYWVSNTKGSTIFLEGNLFSRIHNSGYGGLIFGRYFSNDTSTNLTPESYVKVTLKNEHIERVMTERDGGIVYLEGATQLVNIEIVNATFEDIRSVGYGGIACLFSPSQNLEVNFTSRSYLLAEFQRQLGNVSISQSNMKHIAAQAGGIIFESTLDNTLNLIFESNTLENVSANSRGGVFCLNSPKTLIKSNNFTKITAKKAGTIIYSISDQINLTNFNTSNSIISSLGSCVAFAPTNLLVKFISIEDGSTLELEQQDTPSYYPIVPNLTSYSLSQYLINLTLVYNGSKGFQVVYDESTSYLMSLNFTSPRGGNPQNFEGSNCSNSTCSVFASAVTLKGFADDLILVNASYSSEVYFQTQMFYIRLRSCYPGEINNTGAYECSYCKPGTYSLSPSEIICLECPNGAECRGGADIRIKRGFYRSAVDSNKLEIINCNDSGARCLGGVNNTCSKSFSGPVCLQCDFNNGYIMNGKSSECNLCAGNSRLIALGILLLIASITYQIVMTIVTYRENKNIHVRYQQNKILRELKPGQFMVIFSTFLQIASIIGSLDRGNLATLLNITDVVGNPYTPTIVSLQCIYLLYKSDLFQALLFQVLVYVFSPLVKILVVALFEVFRNLVRKDPEGQGRKKSLIRLGAVAVVLILLEQPGIIGVLCQYLTCSRLDPLVDLYYIKTHNTIQCHTDEYNFFTKVIVVPALIFWAFLVPVGIFVILYKMRKKLFVSQPLNIVLGNFYNSYSESSYYWGVIIMVFKEVIYMLNAVIPGSRVTKGVVFMMIIHFYYFLLKRKSRYPYIYLSLAEKYCVYAYMTALTLAFIGLTVDLIAIQMVCEVLIGVTIGLAGGYILLNMLWLCLLKIDQLLKKLRERKKQKEIVKETLTFLKVYHQTHPKHVDKFHRRGAMIVNMPER